MIVARPIRIAIGLAAAAALCLTAGALVIPRADRADGVAAARHLIADDHRFVNGPHAGSTFADASHLLLDDAKACAKQRSADDRRCAARFSAAAFTSVAAFALVGCTQPGVYRARMDALTQLASVANVDRHRGAAAPPVVPTVPTC